MCLIVSYDVVSLCLMVSNDVVSWCLRCLMMSHGVSGV